jgi:hypothetical protein
MLQTGYGQVTEVGSWILLRSRTGAILEMFRLARRIKFLCADRPLKRAVEHTSGLSQ